MHLAVCESMPHAEVAEVLGITPQAVKSNLAAARKKLRERLGDIDAELHHGDTEKQEDRITGSAG